MEHQQFVEGAAEGEAQYDLHGVRQSASKMQRKFLQMARNNLI
jgi:DNA-nicking Smr family endonuclease